MVNGNQISTTETPDSIKKGFPTGNHLMAPNHMNHTLAITDDTNDQSHLDDRDCVANYAELEEVANQVLNVYYANFKAEGSPDPKLRACQNIKQAFAKQALT